MIKKTIELIYSESMFPGLMMGKAKEGEYENSLNKMEKFLKEKNSSSPIFNCSALKWTILKETKGLELGYGSYGHIAGVILTISEGDDRYSFSIIFNFLPETEKIEDKIEECIDSIDWKNASFKWDIGDL